MTERKWQVVHDKQGGEFGMDRVYTAKQWGEQAYDWADSDDWDDPSECLLENHESEDDLIAWISDMWELEFKEVLFELTEEQKKKFFENYNCGDISALNYLYSIVKNNACDEIEGLVYSLLTLNYMNDIVETRDWENFQMFSDRIVDLYFDMKSELLDACGITSEDWHKYTGC